MNVIGDQRFFENWGDVWYAFVCGGGAGLKLREENNSVLYQVSTQQGLKFTQ